MAASKRRVRRKFLTIGFTPEEFRLLTEEAARRTLDTVDFVGDMALEGLRVENIRGKRPKPLPMRASSYSGGEDYEDMCPGERLAKGGR